MMDWLTYALSLNRLEVQVEGQAWFGGGADLTPAYLCQADAEEFHEFWHGLCSRHKVRKSSSHDVQFVQN